jgi:putative FmdB family regulatory protein
MPIYEYACRTCGAVFEKQLKSADRLAAQVCPSCGQRGAALIMSAPARVGAGASSPASMGSVCPSTGAPCSCGHGHAN